MSPWVLIELASSARDSWEKLRLGLLGVGLELGQGKASIARGRGSSLAGLIRLGHAVGYGGGYLRLGYKGAQALAEPELLSHGRRPIDALPAELPVAPTRSMNSLARDS